MSLRRFLASCRCTTSSAFREHPPFVLAGHAVCRSTVVTVFCNRQYPISASRVQDFLDLRESCDLPRFSRWRLKVCSAATAVTMFVLAAPSSLLRCDTTDDRRRDLNEWAQEVSSGAKEEVDIQMRVKSLQDRHDKHLIWQTLTGERRIKSFRMWHFALAGSGNLQYDADTVPGKTRMVALVDLGDEMDGHPGLVHGGFAAALLDDAFGWTAAYDMRKQIPNAKQIFTANLNVNYRSVMLANAAYTIEVDVEKIVKQKKIYLKATVRDKSGKTVIEGTCLFIAKTG